MRQSFLSLIVGVVLCSGLSSCFDEAGTKAFLFGKKPQQEKTV